MLKIVRNQLDVILSCARGITTLSHSIVPNESFDKDTPEFWAGFIASASDGIAKDHAMTIKDPQSISAKIPTYVVRYEDIV